MNTTLATQQISVSEQSLILPNKREALLMKLNEFKTNNRSAIEQENYMELAEKSTDLFIRLCWSKLGVSATQLQKLEQQDLKELAAIVYEQSKLSAFIHAGILACIPIIGWLLLFGSLKQVMLSHNKFLKNMRYY